jgi:hypothetical protein
MVTDWLGPTAWFLYAPTAAFYFIIAGVIWLAAKAVRDIEDGVKLTLSLALSLTLSLTLALTLTLAPTLTLLLTLTPTPTRVRCEAVEPHGDQDVAELAGRGGYFLRAE